jgi:hypothetical protein
VEEPQQQRQRTQAAGGEEDGRTGAFPSQELVVRSSTTATTPRELGKTPEEGDQLGEQHLDEVPPAARSADHPAELGKAP